MTHDNAANLPTSTIGALQSIAEHLAAIEATTTALAAALTIRGEANDAARRSADVARTLRDFVSPQLRAQRDQLSRLIATHSVAG